MKNPSGVNYLSKTIDQYRNSLPQARSNQYMAPSFRKVITRSTVSSKRRYNNDEGRFRLNSETVGAPGATYRFGVWRRYLNRDRYKSA